MGSGSHEDDPILPYRGDPPGPPDPSGLRPRPPVNPWAALSFVLAMSSGLTCVLPWLMLSLGAGAVLCGGIAVWQLGKNIGRQEGLGVASAGILLGSLAVFLAIQCGVRLRGP